MTKILTPEDILMDELDPRILLKVERLRGPTAWDYDSLIKHSDNSPINWLTKLDEYRNRCRNPCGIQSYADINIVNNNYISASVFITNIFIIGIKALQPVEFNIKIGGSLVATITMTCGEYRDDIISGYPIAMIMLYCHSIHFKFSQGSMNDLELVYSNIHHNDTRSIVECHCVHPYINPIDPDNKYNIVYAYGMICHTKYEDSLKFMKHH